MFNNFKHLLLESQLDVARVTQKKEKTPAHFCAAECEKDRGRTSRNELAMEGYVRPFDFCGRLSGWECKMRRGVFGEIWRPARAGVFVSSFRVLWGGGELFNRPTLTDLIRGACLCICCATFRPPVNKFHRELSHKETPQINST